MAWLAKNAFHYLKKSAAVAQSPGVSQGVGRETTMSLPDRRCSDNSLRHSYVPVRSGERGRFGSLVQMRLDQSWPFGGHISRTTRTSQAEPHARRDVGHEERVAGWLVDAACLHAVAK
jgi:hypothetical protein